MFGLTQISKSPTRILFSSTSLFNQMLTSVPERINQAGVINEKLVYQTTNVLIGLGKIEFKMEVSIKKKIHSLMNYATYIFKSALSKINFPN